MEHPLHTLSPIPIHLVWHENKATYLTVRKERRLLYLRVHRLFYNAPTPVLEALIKYAMKHDKESGVVIKQMAHLYFSQVTIQGAQLETKGDVYDLQEVFDRMNLLLEQPIQGVTIGWSNRKSRGKFNSITFGTYDKHCRQIRINRILDDVGVPRYFLEFIVYHEMLHDVCPSYVDSKGRCYVHTREFRKKEKQFPQFLEAKTWEKKSLNFFYKQSRGKSNGRS